MIKQTPGDVNTSAGVDDEECLVLVDLDCAMGPPGEERRWVSRVQMQSVRLRRVGRSAVGGRRGDGLNRIRCWLSVLLDTALTC